jgi:(p)ppGpp synthase/HD superfamily hydrolase
MPGPPPMKLVMEFGGNEDRAIAALLHDAVEDQSEGFGGPDKLRAEIGRRYRTSVLLIIDAGTDAETVPKRRWEERKRAYIEHIPPSC